jgi:hypothetical protein
VLLFFSAGVLIILWFDEGEMTVGMSFLKSD